MKLNEARIEDERGLAFLVTQGLTNSSIQSNVDALGFENAFHALDKHIDHNAKWCVTTAAQVVGRDAKGVDGLLSLLHWYIDLCYRPEFKYGTNEEGRLELESKGCRAAGIYPLLCEWFCRRDFIFMCEESNPELALDLEECLSKGNDRCLWVIERKDDAVISEIPIPYQPLGIPSGPVETMDYYAQAGAGEFFSQSTASLVSSIGAEKALTLLKKNAARFGEEFGTYLVTKDKKTGPKAAMEALQFIDALFQIRGEISRHDDSNLECNIMACPFRDSPIECCQQMETFRIAVMRTISPDAEIAYHEERRENDCKWSLKIRGKAEQLPMKTETVKEGPIERLMNKMIDGEISEEEFERKMALLKKHMSSK